MKLFDIVSCVVEEGCTQFNDAAALVGAYEWVIHEQRYEILATYCDAIDKISEEFDGISYDVEMDEATGEITISLECADFSATTSEHVFFELIKHTVKWGFSVSEDGNLLMTFRFPSVFEHCSGGGASL